MSVVPTGTVTFLFTDIEGSTKLAQEHRDCWEALRARHHAILHQAMQAHDGHVFQIVGDEFCVAFHTALDAVRAAAEAQKKLFAEPWTPAPIKVRMGIHSGTALAGNDTDRSGGYTGYNALARTARLMSVGHGGQVLVSLATEELVRDELPEGIGLRDLGPRRLKDLIRPEQIFQLILPGLPIDFPPLKTLDAYRHNLPVQLTTFIGREKELAEVRQAIMDHRLVTLTGAGGSGKTRLSLHAAADLLDQFPNGVWFVELASLTNPDLIPQTILSAFGVGDQPGMTTLQLLTDYVRERKLLLVLDNCEHLVEAVAKLVTTLLSGTEDIRILATSREALGVDGELSWYVSSLSLPDIQHLPSIEALSQYEAVRLFIDRAILAQPHFTVTKDNAPAIAQICYRIDGIPLAIELAAARVKALDVDQINKRLDDRFHLLTGGSRTALPRHQTLRATIDWSYELLLEQEKILFRRLAVFSGGWTLEAAEQVCSTEESPLDVLDLLPHLVDKSLVVMDNSTGEARYHMLETTRQYIREKFLETNEEKVIRDLHLRWSRELVNYYQKESLSPKEPYWHHRLVTEIDNLRAALEYIFIKAHPDETSIKMVPDLAEFWVFAGHPNEAMFWLDKAEKTTFEHERSVIRASIIYRQGEVNQELGKWKDSRRQFEEFIEIVGVLGDEYRVNRAYALANLGFQMYDKDHEYETGRKYIEEAIKICRDANNPQGQGFTLRAFSYVKKLEGDFETAITLAEEAASLYREVGAQIDEASCVSALGQCKLAQGSFLEAKKLFENALKASRDYGTKPFTAELLLHIGDACRCLNEYIEAETYYRESLTLRQEIDQNLIGFISNNLNLGYIVLYHGDGRQAVSFFKEALVSSRRREDKENLVLCLAGFAAAASVLEDTEISTLLYGAVDAQIQALLDAGFMYNDLITPPDRLEMERYQALCIAQLGESEYEAALERGRKLTLEQAIDLALEKVGNMVSS